MDYIIAHPRSIKRRPSRCPDHTMKISKSEARYGRGTQKEHCGYSFPGDQNHCQHFIEPTNPKGDTGTCTEVSGTIGRVYWCKLWERKSLSG
jgi:hypothetical protein